ncbi:MAG: diguanylate cyclase (GGDEF)-like protein, partial [Paraglaciecola sp.]
QVDKYWPGMQGIGYAVMLKPEEKEAFVNSVRLEGFNEFTVFPAGLRDNYSSIVYIEPFTVRNKRAFGYDMYSQKTRHIAMDIARDNGGVALSAKVKLVQEDGNDLQNGFLMYLPVYRNGAPIENVSQRQKELVGYIYSPFRIDNLINGIILSDENRRISFSIYDGNSEDTDDLLYAPKRVADYFSAADENEVKPAFSVVKTIEFPGRPWTIHFYSTSVFESNVESYLANLVGLTGVVVALLLLFVMLNITSNSRKDNQAKAELEILVDRLKAGASAGIVGIWDWNIEKNILIWDPVMYQLYGLEKSDFADLYEAWLARVHIDDRSHIDCEIQAALRHEREYCPEFRVLWPDSSVHYIKAVSKTTYDKAGKAIRMVGVNYDITEHKNTQTVLEILVDRLKAGASAGIVGIWDWDIEKDTLNWDPVMYQLYGLEASDFSDLYEAGISKVHIDDRTYVDGEIQAALRHEREYCPEFRIIWPDGSVHYIKAVSKTTFDKAGKAIRMVGVNYDITEQKNIQIRLDQEASFDQLTHLPNRRLLNDRLKQAIAFVDRHKTNLAIFFIDLDGFKKVNDVHGHQIGDWLLKEVSKRIQYCLRATDTVGRIGGDEFVVVLPEIYENAKDVATKIRKILEEPFVITNGEIIHISSSIGVAIYPEHGKNQTMLMECADKAMYEAKKRGRNKVLVCGDF